MFGIFSLLFFNTLPGTLSIWGGLFSRYFTVFRQTSGFIHEPIVMAAVWMTFLQVPIV